MFHIKAVCECDGCKRVEECAHPGKLPDVWSEVNVPSVYARPLQLCHFCTIPVVSALDGLKVKLFK